MMKILFIITCVLLGLVGIYVLWAIFWGITGLCVRKTSYPETKTKLRFAVMICARNEARVIAQLIESLKAVHYPKNYFDIFVVAHNCTDDTAAVAEQAGARVMILNDPDHATKGAALHYGLETVQNADGSYDAFAVFDADNLVDPEFLNEINNAMGAGHPVVQGFRAAKNYHDNLLTKLFGMLWMAMAYAQNLANTAVRLPVTINGTGFAARFDCLTAAGWHTGTLCEDIEFSIQQMLAGNRVVAAGRARFYDEQPIKLSDGLNQRLRWAVGINQCFCRYIVDVIKAIPKRGIDAVKIAMDICLNPVLISGAVGIALSMILLAMEGVSGLILLQILIGLCGCGWLIILPLSLNVIIKERLSLFKNLDVIILFPLFLLLSGVLAFPAPFLMKSLKWKPVAHGCVKGVEEM